ncbi:MAG: hypothetical protein ACF8SC_07080 [Phycisphaerales bacterium JB037]
MDRRDENLPEDRLFEASDAVLEAVAEVSARNGGVCPYPPDLMGTEEQPEAFVPFTRDEIEAASEFLIRLGVLQAKSPSSGSAEPGL